MVTRTYSYSRLSYSGQINFALFPLPLMVLVTVSVSIDYTVELQGVPLDFDKLIEDQ